MRSLFFLFALLMAFSGLAVPEAVIARRAVRDPVIDGRLTEPDWKSARWVTLDRSRPARPRTDGEWNELSRMVGEYVKQQFAQNVQAAALWSERGLYFAFIVEDTDIIGRMKEGELLWLEDVVELFLARNARSGEKHLEIQLNPTNAMMLNPPEGIRFNRPASAVAVDGSLNSHLEFDRQWTAELFLPWEELMRTGLASPPTDENAGRVAAVRFASWDLTICTQLRINRFTGPGTDDPHFPEFYRLLVCEGFESTKP